MSNEIITDVAQSADGAGEFLTWLESAIILGGSLLASRATELIKASPKLFGGKDSERISGFVASGLSFFVAAGAALVINYLAAFLAEVPSGGAWLVVQVLLTWLGAEGYYRLKKLTS